MTSPVFIADACLLARGQRLIHENHACDGGADFGDTPDWDQCDDPDCQAAARILAEWRRHMSYERDDMLWHGVDDLTHRAHGNRMVDTDPGTFIVWTRCGLHDVPGGEAWVDNGESVTCPGCIEAEKVE